mmetsp:Transcript_13412/g.31513  ORF Transcript_13412/g.31513 Transcript_13412/m.31513 type:complete len:186 (-) Transcript_13412:284-841(-)
MAGQFKLLNTEESQDGDVEAPPADAWKPGCGTYVKLMFLYIFIWVSLAAFCYFLWIIGVMQSVVGNILTYPVLFAMALLCVMTVAPCLLSWIASLWWRIPRYIKRKLWEIPPAILPLVETMMKGLLDQMEHRIIEKLKDLPKDCAHAVTHVGGAVKNAVPGHHGDKDKDAEKGAGVSSGSAAKKD